MGLKGPHMYLKCRLFLVIFTKMKTIFLYVTTNICYNQGLYRLRQSTIGTSYGGVALQWRRLCGCVHEGAMARPWTGSSVRP